jgi:hypothetical protein
MVDDKLSVRMGAAAVGADQGTDGSGVGPRLIPEEPMAIVFNLGMSREFFFVEFPLTGADVCCRKLADGRPR